MAAITFFGSGVTANLDGAGPTHAAEFQSLMRLPQNQRISRSIERRLSELKKTELYIGSLLKSQQQSLKVKNFDRQMQRLIQKRRVLNSEIEDLIQKLKPEK